MYIQKQMITTVQDLPVYPSTKVDHRHRSHHYAQWQSLAFAVHISAHDNAKVPLFVID